MRLGLASTSAVIVLQILAFGPAFAETVDVTYRGPVDLAKFDRTGS